MRSRPIRSEACSRTRQGASLRLDSELSELEEAYVDTHLARCEDCRRFAADLGTLTETLRSAPLAQPSVSFRLPARHRPVRTFFAGLAVPAGTAAAAAVVLLIVSGGLVDFRPPARASASEIRSSHERMSFKEQVLQSLESAKPERTGKIRPGLAAAEQTELGAEARTARGATRSIHTGSSRTERVPIPGPEGMGLIKGGSM